MPPWATRPGKAHAAPRGVSASSETASASCVGTRPPHSREAKKTPTGTTTTRSASANRPDSSRDRRSRRNSAVSAMQTRASSTQVATPSTTPIAAAGHGTPCSAQTIAAHTETAISANVGTLRKPATANSAASRPLGRPSTLNLRGSSGSVAPTISGASANPRVTAEPPSTMTASTTAVAASRSVSSAQHDTTVAPMSSRRPSTVRRTCAESPRRAPSSSAILSRRTCAATRGPPRR